MTAENGKGESEGAEVQRWTAKRKAAVVLDLLKGKTTPAQVARQNGLTVADVETWIGAFLRGGEEQLRSNPRDAATAFEAERKELHAKIGEMSLHIDILKKAQSIIERAERGETL